MNRIIYMLLINTLLTTLFSCKKQISPLSDNYYKKGGSIYFIPGGNGFERGSRKIIADLASFTVIGGDYARDKDQVYFMGCPQQSVDVKTFRMKKNIPVDQHHVFYFTGVASSTSPCNKSQLSIVEQADPETYNTAYDELPFLAKDVTSYYYKNRSIQVDRSTFTVLNKKFAKDKNQLYAVTQESIVPLGYTAHQVEVINQEYLLLDRKQLLYDQLEQGIGVLTVSLPSVNQIKLLDAKTVVIDQLVIIEGKIFEDSRVDAKSFELGERSGVYTFWSRDKDYIYYNQQLVPEADPKTFKVLKLAVAKDAKHVFVGKEIFKGPEVKSFRKVDKSPKNYDFEDDRGNRYRYEVNKGQAVLISVTKE